VDQAKRLKELEQEASREKFWKVVDGLKKET
jgi:hypothetical protein